jgi:hypothetical protein
MNETDGLWIGMWQRYLSEAISGTSDVNAEFQVSPHGEWVDLAIDRNPDRWPDGTGIRLCGEGASPMRRRSGMARCASMEKIDARKPQAGQELRMNFSDFRGRRPCVTHRMATDARRDNYHVPKHSAALQAAEYERGMFSLRSLNRLISLATVLRCCSRGK